MLIQIAGALTVSSTINGVGKDDYVLLDSDHTIVSPKTFVSDMVSNFLHFKNRFLKWILFSFMSYGLIYPGVS